MPDPAIVVRELSKHYGPVRALDGLSLTIERGQVFGLLGPNGAGKTTTVETLEGYRQPDSGQVAVLGVDPWRDGDRLRPRIGVMLQAGGLQPGIKVMEALRLFAAFYADPEDPVALLATVGLADHAKSQVRRLSGGQAQRLSLALALIGRPELVFLDEPTAGMDPHARATTWKFIRSLRGRGVTVVLTTHAMDEAEALCDQLAIIDHGRVVAQGTPAELTGAHAGSEVRFRAKPGIDLDALAAGLEVERSLVHAEHADEYVVDIDASPALVARLAIWMRDQDLAIEELNTGRRSLEEVFLRLTAESAATVASGVIA
ncbi:MAG: ABC transporter ATP-binding protein [Acidimicrobiia bacterium]